MEIIILLRMETAILLAACFPMMATETCWIKSAENRLDRTIAKKNMSIEGKRAV